MSGSGSIENSTPIAHGTPRSEEHTSELQSPCKLVCRLLLEKKNQKMMPVTKPAMISTPIPNTELGRTSTPQSSTTKFQARAIRPGRGGAPSALLIAVHLVLRGSLFFF